MTGPRTLHQLLAAIPRMMGNPRATPHELRGLAIGIKRRAAAVARDLDAIAASREARGHQEESEDDNG